jgi:hypothetical protein
MRYVECNKFLLIVTGNNWQKSIQINLCELVKTELSELCLEFSYVLIICCCPVRDNFQSEGFGIKHTFKFYCYTIRYMT